jgi:hypothetical protein
MGQFDIYNNGPTNGTVDAWTINFGFAVSNTFVISDPGTTTLNGLDFAAWVFPGDVMQSAEVTMTSEEFGGTTYFDQTVSFTQSNCVANQYGFNVCTESGTFSGPSMNAGTYWMTLQNATVTNSDPVYWDENSGPSSASENTVGTLTSESFTLFGSTSTGPGTGPGSTPEPSSILLFGSGVLGVGAFIRRKLF